MQERANEGRRTDPRLRQTRTIVLDRGDAEQKREEIRAYFHDTWDIDEALLEMLRYEETFYLRADPLRHPLIFYFGHTAVFYVNKLIIGKVLQERIRPDFESMFAIGVDEMSWDDLDETHYDWPPVEEVRVYRNRVRELVDQIITTLPLEMPIAWDNPWWIVVMGIEHARIHLETSSVLLRQLPLDQLRPHPLWEICPHRSKEVPENALLEVPGGEMVLGKNRDHPLYGWDNEYGKHVERVEPFRASRSLVSNGEFMEFIDADGYHEERWWTEEGWQWRNYEKAERPRFWRLEGDRWQLRLVADQIDMPWDWPVEVNYLEAKAFCNWKAESEGKPIRLPTEAEWYRLRDLVMHEDQPDWDQAPGNLNLEHYASSCPVTEFAFGDFYDVVGNVWQWTETPITAFQGFEPHPCYDDFSVPTFDLKHNLIKGGSWISTGNEATRDSRYAFRRHFYQHAGLRYVESEHPVSLPTNVYESNPLIAQYCEGHYGQKYFGEELFPKAIARLSIEAMGDHPRRKALDLGCSVGRATFELAREFEEVIGLDFSTRFIRLGVELREQGFLRYERIEEGDLVSFHETTLEKLGLAETVDRVTFEQADACNLKPRYSDFDLVLAANLIDRLSTPRKFLEMIHERIVPGGLLVVSSPYSWDEKFTEKDQWIGGFRVAGEPYTTLEGLHDCLDPHFERIGSPQAVPMVLRETKRKFQHTQCEVTVWQRRG